MRITEKDFQQFMIEHMTKLTDDVTDLRQNMVRMEFQLTEKIDALFDAQAAANEKLDEHSAILNKHSIILDEHSAIFNKHSIILDENSAILTDHTERLQRIEDKVEGHDIQIQVLDKTKSNKHKVK